MLAVFAASIAVSYPRGTNRHIARPAMLLIPFASISNLIGTLAAVLTTLAFIPQAWLTWKSRRAEGVSLATYSMFTIGVGLWLLYGVLLGAWPVIIANLLTLVLAVFILVMKLRFG